MDRRVTIIRFWLLCLASLAVAVCWPQFGVGLWPVVFFFPTCTCCGVDCTDACNTGTTPASISFVVSGFVDSTCTTCEELDGTFVVPIHISGLNCTGRLTTTFTCTPGTGLGLATYTWSVFSGETLLAFTHRVGSGLTDATYSYITSLGTLGANPIDCDTISSVSLPFQTQNHVTTVWCDGSGATVTATA